MTDDDLASAQGVLIAQSWLATVILGAVTLILGLIVSFHPGGSLNVVAVLLGILAICSGIFHLVRIFGRGERTGCGAASSAWRSSSSASC